MILSVVIPTFNRCDSLRDIVLPALNAQTRAGFEVIVIDNASTDGTAEALAADIAAGRYRFDLIYRRKDPQGPAAARNLGTDIARAPYVAFVDSDVELAPDWLEIAHARMQAEPDLGAVGGRVIYANDRGYLNAFGGALSRIGLAWDRLEGQPIETAGAPQAVLWMNCSAALMRKAALTATGGFDDRYFYAFEDSDVGWRMALTGWRQIVVPQAVLYHHVGDDIAPSSGGIAFHVTKNRLASLLANAGGGMLLRHLPLHLGYALADALLRANKGAKLRGLWWNVTHLPGTLARRKLVQSRRKVADADLPFADTLFPKTRLGGMRRRPNRQQTVVARTDDDRV